LNEEFLQHFLSKMQISGSSSLNASYHALPGSGVHEAKPLFHGQKAVVQPIEPARMMLRFFPQAGTVET
jgi:hypothetical protein